MAAHDNPGVSELFQDILDNLEGPGARANFFARFQGPGYTSAQRRFLGSQFEGRKSGFLGRIGEQMRSGQDPTATFSQDLDRLFNPREQIARSTPLNTRFTGGNRLLTFSR